MKNITGSSILDIQEFLEKEALKRGKEISWFTYAKKTKMGAWRFLAYKDKQIRILEEVSQLYSQKYPEYSKGQIADAISNIVNTKALT